MYQHGHQALACSLRLQVWAADFGPGTAEFEF